MAIRSRHIQHQGDQAATATEMRLLQHLIASMPHQVVFAIDREREITHWNSACRRLFGYPSNEIIGRSISFLHPRSGKNIKHIRHCMERGGKGDQWEGTWMRKDHSQFRGQCICMALSSKRAKANGFAVVLQDITARTRAEEEHAMLTSIIENCEDAVISKDLTGTITTWNKSAQRLFGYRENEIVGKSITRLIPHDRMNEERLILGRLRRGKRIEHYETVRVAKDGRRIDVSISVSPMRGPDGRISGASKIVRDITERNLARESHKDTENSLQAILNTATDAIITIDARGMIQSANSATEKLFGYRSAELAGRNVNILMPEPFHSEHDGYIRNYCRTGKAKIIGIGREVTGLRKDGTTFPMHLSVSEVVLGGHRLFTGIVHDLTGRRLLERQIMETAANEQRRIGQDLHDGLCQDLVGIAFGISAVERAMPADADKEQLAKLAAAVRDAAGQARQLAHGLNPVDLSAGGLTVALENLAIKVAESFHITCTFHDDHFNALCDDATATHLYRIAQEAVGNAIRHGKADDVEIRLAQRGSYIVLSVMDNGIGMPQEYADRIKQGLTPSAAHQTASGGIGLQTMQYRAHVLGGDFLAVPRKGGGTIITCTVAREQNASPPGLQKRSKNTSRARRARHR